MNGFYWIYLIMFIFLLSYDYVQSARHKHILFFFACGFLIFLFAVQDHSVSMDIHEYLRQWAIIPNLTFSQMLTHKFEIGFVMLCYMLERLFTGSRSLLLCVGCLVILLFARSYRKETENPMLALMFFVALGMYLHAIIFWRQLIAMAILTLSYPYIRERRFLPFCCVLLLAMSFHKVSIVFLPLYFFYRIPVSKWLLLFCAVCACLLSIFGKSIIEFGIATIYPRYTRVPREVIGGGNLLLVLWILVFFSYWLLKPHMANGFDKLPFLMVLVAATIQPICFSHFVWFRVVLFFRIALIPLSVQLYTHLFRETEQNRVLSVIRSISAAHHGILLSLYRKHWFPALAKTITFCVLFFWYLSELEDCVYRMASIFS